MFDLNGKTALVTGSTQGIGYAVAAAYVKAGAKVYVHCSSDIEKAKRTASEIGAFGAVTADLSDLDKTARLFEKTGAVDILFLNASVQVRKKWYEVSPEEARRQLAVNFESTLMLMQKYYPAMKEKGWGRIITVGSVQQYRPHKDMCVYAASKSAVMNLVENVASQIACEGITVNNISPGVIATPRNADALSDEQYRKAVMSKIPAGYAGEPFDIAGAALLLASEEGRYITGIDLTVDGGMKL